MVQFYGGPYLQTQQAILETQHNIFETQVNICETQHKIIETKTEYLEKGLAIRTQIGDNEVEVISLYINLGNVFRCSIPANSHALGVSLTPAG